MDEFKVSNSSLPQAGQRAGVKAVQAAPVKPAVVANTERQMADIANQERQEDSAPATAEQVKEAVQKLNDYVQTVQRSLQFDFDEQAGKSIITVVDRDTREVIRQIPDELAIKMARNLNDDEPVSLFTVKV